MPALFPEWSHTAFSLALVTLIAGAISVVVGLMIYVRSPYNTQQFRELEQPVEFDHRHHARDDGIDCLYCHLDAERSPSAGVPSSALCMGCHAQIRLASPLLAPVRRSVATGLPIPWRRVHDLAEFVYFDHSVHVRGGIECERCHGEVGRMARVYRENPLQMRWCLDCHRDPPSASLPRTREINRLTTCSACHR